MIRWWVCMPAVLALLGETDELSVPHRQGEIIVDGALDDWEGPSLSVDLVDPERDSPLSNTGKVRLTWDATHLWVAFEVEDADVVRPPPEAAGRFLYQWDSVEVYLDTDATFAKRMEPSDFQLIVTCDARVAVLQGDPLVADIEAMGVPKSERPGIVVEAATEVSASGYTVEFKVPLAAVGLAEVGEGTRLGVDLAWNDWIEEHLQLPEPVFDLANLNRFRRNEWKDVEYINPHDLDLTTASAIRDRAYKPWSWASGRDFGYPHQWRRVRLVGGPPLGEAIVEHVGGWNLALLLAGATALLLVGVGLVLLGRGRRRVRTLIVRLDRLQEQGEVAAVPTPTEVPAAIPAVPAVPQESKLSGPVAHTPAWVRQVGPMLGEEMPTTPLTRRALAFLRDHLEQAVSVGSFASALHVSARTLQRELKETLGCSPSDLIVAVKMRAAKSLLQAGECRVSEAGYRVGFENPDHFSRRFKAFYGVAPSTVRGPPE